MDENVCEICRLHVGQRHFRDFDPKNCLTFDTAFWTSRLAVLEDALLEGVLEVGALDEPLLVEAEPPDGPTTGAARAFIASEVSG